MGDKRVERFKDMITIKVRVGVTWRANDWGAGAWRVAAEFDFVTLVVFTVGLTL